MATGVGGCGEGGEVYGVVRPAMAAWKLRPGTWTWTELAAGEVVDVQVRGTNPIDLGAVTGQNRRVNYSATASRAISRRMMTGSGRFVAGARSWRR